MIAMSHLSLCPPDTALLPMKCSAKCKRACPAPQSLKLDDSNTRPNERSFSDDHLLVASDVAHSSRTQENMQIVQCSLVRRQMVNIIEERLNGDDPSSKECLAQALERHLYNRAASFEDYSDVYTLNSRLKRLTRALVRRRRLREQDARLIQPPEPTLQQIIGEEKYQLVQELIDEVHRLRLSRCSSCCSTKMGSCPRDVPPGLPAQQVMPPPIRDLFFRADLLNAVSSTPAACLPFVDWDAKLQQTQEVIRTYKEWLEAQSPESALQNYSEV